MQKTTNDFHAFVSGFQRYNATVSFNRSALVEEYIYKFGTGKYYSDLKKMERELVKYLKTDPDKIGIKCWSRYITLDYKK